jgi:hypothetical protein
MKLTGEHKSRGLLVWSLSSAAEKMKTGPKTDSHGAGVQRLTQAGQEKGTYSVEQAR